MIIISGSRGIYINRSGPMVMELCFAFSLFIDYKALFYSNTSFSFMT